MQGAKLTGSQDRQFGSENKGKERTEMGPWKKDGIEEMKD